MSTAWGTNSLAASSSTMKGEPVCCWTSQLWATASIQLPVLLTRAPSQIQRKAGWRRTANSARGLIPEATGPLHKLRSEVYASSMREILPGILTWPWFSPRHGYDFNGWLVRHPEGNLCIDPAEMTDEVLDELARGGVARVLITNRNHFRSSMRVKERTGARIAIHPEDAAFARERGTAIDDELQTGRRVGPLAVVAAPGKSPGEVALHWPPRPAPPAGSRVVPARPPWCAGPRISADLPPTGPARWRRRPDMTPPPASASGSRAAPRPRSAPTRPAVQRSLRARRSRSSEPAPASRPAGPVPA